MKKLISLFAILLLLSILCLTSCVIEGIDGKDGETPTIEISEDGYWVINGEKTNVKASSEAGIDENPQGLQFYKQDDGTYIVSCGDAKYLSNIVIPPTYKGGRVVGIDENAFYNCVTLKSVTIPNSVTSIGERAFYNCDNLTSVTIPDSVTSIGNNAFSGCLGLVYNEYDNASYLGNDSNPYFVLVKPKDTSITNLIINENTKFIYYEAFSSCINLTSVTIPDSVTSIGNNAFSYCTSLTSVTIGNSVTSIGNIAFSGCSSLTSVTISDSVTSIGNNAFSYCTSLTSVTIPDSVTIIGESAFRCCTRLTSVTIPDSVTSIDSYAFYYCPNLTNLTYEGAVEQWNAIFFGSDWKHDIPATEVVCSDGTVTL